VLDQVRNLSGLQIDLLIEVNSLLSDHIKLENLLIDDLLSLFKSTVDLIDLVFNLFNLVLSV
jgi:hypothetical protein